MQVSVALPMLLPSRCAMMTHVACSRSIQQPDQNGIDDLGLLVFVGGIDHIVFDLHRFWKVHRSKLKQFSAPPETNQLPDQIVADSLIAPGSDQNDILDPRGLVKRSGKGRHADTQELAQSPRGKA